MPERLKRGPVGLGVLLHPPQGAAGASELYDRGLLCFDFVPGLLCSLSWLPGVLLAPGPDPVQASGLVSSHLPGDSANPHNPGRSDCSAGDHYAEPSAAAAIRSASQNRPLDVA